MDGLDWQQAIAKAQAMLAAHFARKIAEAPTVIVNGEEVYKDVYEVRKMIADSSRLHILAEEILKDDL